MCSMYLIAQCTMQYGFDIRRELFRLAMHERLLFFVRGWLSGWLGAYQNYRRRLRRGIVAPPEQPPQAICRYCVSIFTVPWLGW